MFDVVSIFLAAVLKAFTDAEHWDMVLRNTFGSCSVIDKLVIFRHHGLGALWIPTVVVFLSNIGW